MCVQIHTPQAGEERPRSSLPWAPGYMGPINILNCVIHGSFSVSSFASSPQVPIGTPDYIDGTVGPLPTQ